MPNQQEKILSFEDARRCVEDHAKEVHTPLMESVPLLESAGRFLAEDLAADRDLPPFPRATREGYAVRSADLANIPSILKLAGHLKAGEDRVFPPLKPGTCIEIMTGAPAPSGADSVVMVEFTRAGDDWVQVEQKTKPGENIVATGSEARRGQVILKRGVRMGHAQIGLAVAVGKAKVGVFRRPRVAILSTGDEIVEVEKSPALYQVRNSNSYSLAAQVEACGGEAVRLPIAPDDKPRLQSLVQEGLEADLLILSGGVSMGKYDLVEDVLRSHGSDFFFTGALIQPGRPVVFGRGRKGKRTFFFGLPGNPISTMVTFELFARTMVEALAGGRSTPLPFASASLSRPVMTKPGLTRFLPAILGGDHVKPKVELIAWQGSGDLPATAKANCFLVVTPDRPELAAGEMVTVLLMRK